ncbi:MAG: GntR family transcriptional regulator [Candidatus Marinimicrobia bacterium]|nr:GntR family transcriptional regulator [Candidatus Neomarinimicrobiota bacterium]MCF7829525.1 GntR family transcriptional regulator [Candidatus Neomarinimicrobiota bacterium]MCF7880077.1 GntR family transcriptional regulator [Candidatus Neomarinimicrobiota bacterium]
MQFEHDAPIYLQIAEMIRQSIMAGEIAEGEAIPSVRQISVEQNLNPQTVLNATQELINEDLIEKRRGLGMFVKKGARQRLRDSECESFKQQEIPEMVRQAKLLDISKQELLTIIENTYQGDE